MLGEVRREQEKAVDGGKKWWESTRDKLKSDLFVGTGPGCRYLGRQVTFNYLSSYAVDLEASLLRLDEDGVEGHAGKRLALENSY